MSVLLFVTFPRTRSVEQPMRKEDLEAEEEPTVTTSRQQRAAGSRTASVGGKEEKRPSE